MIDLRPATQADVPALARLGRESFRAAFEPLYDPADLAAFLNDVYDDRVVAGEVADTRCIHRLAWQGADLVGFCKLILASPYLEHSGATNPIALGQLYTDPARTGQGVGALLMDWALGHARGAGHDAVQLSVYCDNTGAQRFYARYGFRKIADIDFWVGGQRDDEFLLELRLD
jgi:ribosomal protein S18 acetylase RimI-like enzyme